MVILLLMPPSQLGLQTCGITTPGLLVEMRSHKLFAWLSSNLDPPNLHPIPSSWDYPIPSSWDYICDPSHQAKSQHLKDGKGLRVGYKSTIVHKSKYILKIFYILRFNFSSFKMKG
jgi:hypothetical protein